MLAPGVMTGPGLVWRPARQRAEAGGHNQRLGVRAVGDGGRVVTSPGQRGYRDPGGAGGGHHREV